MQLESPLFTIWQKTCWRNCLAIMCHMRSGLIFFFIIFFIALVLLATKSEMCIFLNEGQSQVAEDGRSKPDDYLPASGSGSNAENNHCGAH